MSSSARLYERLGQIPEDPENPESLEDLIVCAFGAFDRYYVCWKTRGGDYRQDGYDLPPELEDWLFTTEGARDFESLQVVFGRGDEFFASDKNGKLEYKEPEKKEPPLEEREEKRALKRSRTISFMRPRYDESPKPNDLDSPSSSRRSSLISGRPPSLALTSRTLSDASLHSHSRLSSDSSVSSQLWSRPLNNQKTVPSRPPDLDNKSEDSTVDLNDEGAIPSPIPTSTQQTRRPRPLSMSLKTSLFPRIPEGKQVPSPESQYPIPPAKLPSSHPDSTSAFPPAPYALPSQTSPPNRHPPPSAPSTSSPSPPLLQRDPPNPDSSPPPPSAPLSLQIIPTAAQTTPIPPISNSTPPPNPPTLTIQITTLSTTPISPLPAFLQTPTRPTTSTSITKSTQTTPPLTPLHIPSSNTTPYPTTTTTTPITTPEDSFPTSAPPPPPPVFMGRMMDYYKRPGYQLGDSLMSAYYYAGAQTEVVYEYEYEYEYQEGELDEWERANGRGW